MKRNLINWRRINYPPSQGKLMPIFFISLLILVLTGALFVLSSCDPGGPPGNNDDNTVIPDDNDDDGISVVADLPDAIELVLGRGYDITESYASSYEIRGAVLDLNKLLAGGLVKRDPNFREARFESVSGYTIQNYQNSLATRVSTSANAGVEGVGSFSTEVGASFGMERARNSQYAFATNTSRIGRDAYLIDHRLAPANVLDYVSDTFASNVQTMTPAELIAAYGTHVMFGGILGARLDYHMTVKVKSESSEYSIGAYAKAQAEVTLEGVTAGGGSSASVDTTFGEYFETSSIETNTHAVGGDPEFAQEVQDELDYDNWINSIAGNEVWCDYYPQSLVPIYEFITDAEEKTAVEAYYEQYFLDKEIQVSTETDQDLVIEQGLTISGSSKVTNDAVGSDDEIGSADGKQTEFTLTVTPSIADGGESDNIEVEFILEAGEQGDGDGTRLKLTDTRTLNVGKNITNIDSPSQWIISGYVERDVANVSIPLIDATSRFVPGTTSIPRDTESPMLFNTFIRLDGGTSDDKGALRIDTDIKISYTYMGAE